MLLEILYLWTKLNKMLKVQYLPVLESGKVIPFMRNLKILYNNLNKTYVSFLTKMVIVTFSLRVSIKTLPLINLFEG